ncbi:MAG: hypothetical protein MUF31_06220 [Akkermansiaceae bacterium]|jgi:hypothetical protein|nr:hypothetical protein [Akkermansiaceae bacterium]
MKTLQFKGYTINISQIAYTKYRGRIDRNQQYPESETIPASFIIVFSGGAQLEFIEPEAQEIHEVLGSVQII